jgi:hypothetical protein
LYWKLQQIAVQQQLSPEVAGFVLLALRSLEEENVFDAPGVISAVVRRMRGADSDVIRNATGRTERLLKTTFARGCMHRMGA